MKKIVSVALCLLILGALGIFLTRQKQVQKESATSIQQTKQLLPSVTPAHSLPLAVVTLRNRSYPGSAITIDQTLPDGSNYHQYIASYQSDGLTIYALLTIPIGNKPADGWPVILFNHGYIPPSSYTTTGNYQAYVTALASHGYMVFKPDYRGNGNSQGTPLQSYIAPDYVIDDLNALASIKKYKDANPQKIGIWGHSMGGFITLSDLVIRPHDAQAAVIWGGVVGSASDLLQWWNERVKTGVLTTPNDQQTAVVVQQMVKEHGTPSENPAFWNSIDPSHFVSDITTPIQLAVGEDDQTVPPSFSTNFYSLMKKNGKSVVIYTYPGSDHNLAQAFSLAMQHTITFFDTYLK